MPCKTGNLQYMAQSDALKDTGVVAAVFLNHFATDLFGGLSYCRSYT